MSQNMVRPTSVDDQIGLEVVSGLESTLAWIKTQFSDFKSDVHEERSSGVSISAR